MAADVMIPPPTSMHGQIGTKQQRHEGRSTRRCCARKLDTGWAAGAGRPDALLVSDVLALDVPIIKKLNPPLSLGSKYNNLKEKCQLKRALRFALLASIYSIPFFFKCWFTNLKHKIWFEDLRLCQI
jgi:hypothetical protein